MKTDYKAINLRSANENSAASLLRIRRAGRLNVVHVDLDSFTNQFFAQEFAGFVHPWDVVNRAETLLLFSFALLIQAR